MLFLNATSEKTTSQIAAEKAIADAAPLSSCQTALDTPGSVAGRLLDLLEQAVNEIPMAGESEGQFTGCQSTFGLAQSRDSRGRNCCATPGWGKGLRFTVPTGHCNTGAGQDTGHHAITCDSKAQSTCKWPEGFDQSMDPSIHMHRVASCEGQQYPFCVMIKVTANASAVDGFARIVPTGNPPKEEKKPLTLEAMNEFGLPGAKNKYIQDKTIYDLVQNADSMIRKAVATLRFELAGSILFGKGAPEPLMLPAAPAGPQKWFIEACEKIMCGVHIRDPQTMATTCTDRWGDRGTYPCTRRTFPWVDALACSNGTKLTRVDPVP